MKSRNKELASLFSTGFLQVVLVAINTYQIANNKLLGALVVGFLISFVWSLNVKRVAFGSTIDRIVYASGAGIGSAAGLLVANAFYG